MPDILRYRGDITAGLVQDQMIGPDFGGRHLGIRSASYDSTTDITTIVLRGILPDEYRERLTPLVEQAREQARIREVFNG